MIIIAHGNDITSSRNFYITERQKIVDPQVLEGEKLEYNLFFQTFEGDTLFSSTKNVFIENFFSSKKSNSEEVKKIVEYINKSKDLSIFFWEPKELTKAQSALIKNALVKQFSYPQVLFTFLDSIKPSNQSLISLFKDLQKTMETELVFYMMVRQFRLLLGLFENSETKIDEVKRLAPWQMGKLQKQAKYFEKEKLLNAYKKLYKIDYETKYGLSAMNLESRIDIFLINL